MAKMPVNTCLLLYVIFDAYVPLLYCCGFCFCNYSLASASVVDFASEFWHICMCGWDLK